VSCLSLASMSLVSGYSSLPDDPAPRPLVGAELSTSVAARMQRVAFIDTFVILVTFFAFVHLAISAVAWARSGARRPREYWTGPLGRQLLVRLLLLAIFVSAWASAWLDALTQDVKAYAWEARPFAWLTVVAAGVAMISYCRRQRGGMGPSTTWLAIALISAIGIAVFDGTARLTIALSVLAVGWSSFDRGLRVEAGVSS
jgi:hypothetical protein